jgi:glycosyltransferase involved in cell wall biosynthesis
MASECWPAVTVVIPTAGRPELLGAAVDAVLEQDYPGAIECLIVFDGVAVDVPDVACGYGRTVAGIANKRAAGLTGARNTGAAAAGGELIAFCDDDDRWMPSKLRKQVRALDAAPAASAASCWNVVQYDGAATERRCGEMIRFNDLLGSRVAVLHSSTIVVRRSTYFDAIGPVDESIPGGASEDYEWQLRAARHGPIVVVPESLVRILWHHGSRYSKRWDLFVAGLEYVLARNPEFVTAPRGAARVYGQIAFGYGAQGLRARSLAWARRALAASWREPRAYIACAVVLGLLSPDWVVHRLQLRGRGI